MDIRTPNPVAEVSWFAPLCSDDYEFLGEPSPALASSLAHTRSIAAAADRLGFNNMLCPSSYQAGVDPLVFAAAVGPQLSQMHLLTAIRCGEMHPLMLARALAGVDEALGGRLTINIISSEMPGESLSSEARYRRSAELVTILKRCWADDTISFKGEFFSFDEVTTKPVKLSHSKRAPLLYFGGMAPAGLELCAAEGDVYLMWPETDDRLLGLMRDVSRRAAAHDRTVDFGLRIHVIVRETESEARAYAQRLVSRLDDATGAQIRGRALDAKSLGVARQAEMRDLADADGYVGRHLWTGIGRARSGCGCALVGDPDQIYGELTRYMEMGFRSFILSGYPHGQECNLFGKYVLPRLPTVALSSLRRPASQSSVGR
jgi:alkanesulfonate monooxygenase